MKLVAKLLVAGLTITSLGMAGCHTMGPAEKKGAQWDKALGTDRPNKDGPIENLGERVDSATGQKKDDLDSPKK